MGPQGSSFVLVLALQLVLVPSGLAQDQTDSGENAPRERATDERFECVPPETEAREAEDLGFDQFALPLDPVVAEQQASSASPVDGEGQAGHLCR